MILPTCALCFTVLLDDAGAASSEPVAGGPVGPMYCEPCYAAYESWLIEESEDPLPGV